MESPMEELLLDLEACEHAVVNAASTGQSMKRQSKELHTTAALMLLCCTTTFIKNGTNHKTQLLTKK